MLYEINLVAGKMLILQHKLIEVIKINPSLITQHHQFEYNQKIREKWNESVFRNVIPTPDFALISQENIGETNRKLAKTKRENAYYTEPDQLKVSFTYL